MSYWIQGRKYTIEANQTVNITDTEGLWYIYFDGAVLTASQTPWVWSDGDFAPVAILYYDADGNTELEIFWEFHSYQWSPSAHDRDHNAIGCYFASGFTLSEASEQISLTDGILWDEDIKISVVDGASGLFVQDIRTPGKFPVWYRSGATAWRKYAATNFPFWDAATVDNVHYNLYSAPNWSSAEATNTAKYISYWLCGSNGIAEPIFSIMGQAEFSTAAGAAAEVISDLNLTGLPFQEIKFLYHLVYKSNSTYNSSFDLRTIQTPGGVYTPPPSIEDSTKFVWSTADPAAMTYLKTGLTDNTNWNDLDVSALVDSGAVGVVFRVIANDNLVGSVIQFRKNGQTNTFQVSALWTQVANVYTDLNMLTGLDSVGKCEINVSPKPTDWVYIGIIVLGWWVPRND